MKIAITSTMGDPRDPRTWSNAPAHLADALERRGVDVVAIDTGLFSTPRKYALAALSAARGMPSRGFALDMPARRARGRFVTAMAAAAKADLILCCGSLDVPVDSAIPYAMWFDNDWHLLQRGATALPYSPRVTAAIDALERRAFRGARLVAPFSRHVRDDVVDHYGVAPEQAVAIGCGAGPLPPFTGEKDFSRGHLLFVAKHLFASKGGELTLTAFEHIRAARPQTRLVIVGTDATAERLRGVPGVTAHGFVARETLNQLFHDAAMLVQPMLADPWGQVYIEAQKARAVVVALDVAAVSELTCEGTLGVIAAAPTAEAIAEAVLVTYARPQRDLDEMTRRAQQHALRTHDWDRVASRLLDAIAATGTVADTATLQ